MKLTPAAGLFVAFFWWAPVLLAVAAVSAVARWLA
jgi:hypothetical protein